MELCWSLLFVVLVGSAGGGDGKRRVGWRSEWGEIGS